jgi:hypothetical protein
MIDLYNHIIPKEITPVMAHNLTKETPLID